MASEHPRNVYGMGESLGAAVLLQALGRERRFSAVVAECPFANFERVAEDRVAQRIPGPSVIAADVGLADGFDRILVRAGEIWAGFPRCFA
jgi:hypothetical protein